MRGSKSGVRLDRQAQGLHAPPAIAGRRIASRHHAVVVPASKRKHQSYNRDFEARPPMFGGMARITPGCALWLGVGVKSANSHDVFGIVA